ncbi:MAG: RNA polymerase sigma factor [Cellvibrionaceae bacterium]
MSFDKDQLNQLYQYAMTLAQQPADAYDLLQESLERYLNAVASNKDIDKPLTYVRTLIRHRFIDRYRYDKRWQLSPCDELEFPTAIDLSFNSLEELHIQADLMERIWQQISPIDRDILYHWAILGFTTQETSELLNIPKGTLLSRVHRLRQQFQSSAFAEGDYRDR